MRQGDTIAAIASPPGRSARGVLRLSGPQCQQIADSLLGAPRFVRSAAVVRLSIHNQTLAVPALLYAAPASYTGEDMIELFPPGNPDLLELALQRFLNEPNVRLASPGEFTARAYLNGRISIDQAEGVAMIIAAHGDDELDAARRTLSGDAGRAYLATADEIAAALALVEAGIDFADQEDVIPIAPQALRLRLSAIHTSLLDALGAAARQSTSRRVRIALVGPPNAGKSTLFNALLGKPRAVVSEQAGTTRDVIEEICDLSDASPGAATVTLVDLAGLDETLTSRIDKASQDAARNEIDRADALILCDPEGRFQFAAAFPAKPMLRVRTKADLPAAVDSAESLAVCAIDGWNLNALRRAIADLASGARGAATLLAPRHAEALRQAASSINSAMRHLEASAGARHIVNAEIIADELRAALDAAGAITGAVTPDDVIGRIFASFCIGK